jgi:signal transduction histidine kinase
MTRGQVGSGRIQVANAEPKLVAYTPFAVGNHTWSLALATPTHLAVAEGLRGQLSLFIFAGAIMLVMVAGALLLDRESSRRIRIAEAFNRDLERRVAERTDELRALYDRLSTLQSHHTRLERVAVAGEMASIVAHEIRTPLNALSINAQMISRSLRRDTAAGRKRALEVLGTLQHEIERINNLLEDHVLAVVRHRHNEPVALCLDDLVLDSIRFMEPEANRQQVRLIHVPGGELSAVCADPAKLRQILLNIILNAIQAMPDGGDVRLSTRQEGGQAIISIRDSGPGLPTAVITEDGEELERVFRPFVTTKQDGTGLGLAVCARLIRGMNGRIRVRSKPGEGACFEVMLPTDGGERCP